MHDLVIDNASVIDGLGGPARAGGVAVTDGRIVAVGGDLGAARRRVDARGLTLAAGPHQLWAQTGVVNRILGAGR